MGYRIRIDLGDFADDFNARRTISAELRSRLLELSCDEHQEQASVSVSGEAVVNVDTCCPRFQEAVHRALDTVPRGTS